MSNGAISDLPMLNDMDADYSPQYVKLARILRAEIEGPVPVRDVLPSADLARQYEVSVRVAATRWRCSPPTDTSPVGNFASYLWGSDLRKCPVRNVRVLHSVVDLPPGGSFPLWNPAKDSSSWSTHG